mmetsp:Transcript_11928/g.26911  ORF Transcript_11928/g.26911 Transcript_11928/m.26911 type:complete len:209 (+) Transcript_11928:1447-2073(+)
MDAGCRIRRQQQRHGRFVPRRGTLCHVRRQLRIRRVVARAAERPEVFLQGTTPAPRLQVRTRRRAGPRPLFHVAAESPHPGSSRKLPGHPTGRRARHDRDGRRLFPGGDWNRQGDEGDPRSVPLVLQQGPRLPGNGTDGRRVCPLPGARGGGRFEEHRGGLPGGGSEKQRRRHRGRILHARVCAAKESLETVGRYGLPLRVEGCRGSR